LHLLFNLSNNPPSQIDITNFSRTIKTYNQAYKYDAFGNHRPEKKLLQTDWLMQAESDAVALLAHMQIHDSVEDFPR